jgi:hypothetical protein
LADGFSKNITRDLFDYHTPSYLLSSDDWNNNMDDPNTIGRVLENMCWIMRLGRLSGLIRLRWEHQS